MWERFAVRENLENENCPQFKDFESPREVTEL